MKNCLIGTDWVAQIVDFALNYCKLRWYAKEVLSEQALYYGDVAMPKDWDIDRDKLSGDILQSQITKHLSIFTNLGYVEYLYTEIVNLEHGVNLINKKTSEIFVNPQR